MFMPVNGWCCARNCAATLGFLQAKSGLVAASFSANTPWRTLNDGGLLAPDKAAKEFQSRSISPM
jgi:hypothetical protein